MMHSAARPPAGLLNRFRPPNVQPPPPPPAPAELAEFKRELGRLHFTLGHETVTDYRTTTAMPAVDTKANLVKHVKVHTHRTNFVLGDEGLDYRSQSMMMSGQKAVKLHDPYMPRRDGSWKKRLGATGGAASAGST